MKTLRAFMQKHSIDKLDVIAGIIWAVALLSVYACAIGLAFWTFS